MLVGGLAVAIALVTWWAFRPPKPRAATGQDAPNVERVMPAEGLQRLPSDYRQVPPSPPPQKTDEAAPAPEEPAEKSTLQDQAARAEQQRLQSEAEAAAKAQVLFQTSRLAASVAPSSPVIGNAPPGSPPPPSRDDDYAQQNQQASKQAFVDAAGRVEKCQRKFGGNYFAKKK